MAANRWLHSAVWCPAYWAENLSELSFVCYGRGSHSKCSKDCELYGIGHVRSSYKGATEKVRSVCFLQCLSPPEIVFWTMCWFGLFLVVMLQSWSMEFLGNFRSLHSCLRHGWQNKLSSTMVFSLSVLQHYAMSCMNKVCHLFRSAMIMPWAVCPSSVFKNWSKLPNSEWNTDGAAGFTTIWVDRRFEDSSNVLVGSGQVLRTCTGRKTFPPSTSLQVTGEI